MMVLTFTVAVLLGLGIGVFLGMWATAHSVAWCAKNNKLFDVHYSVIDTRGNKELGIPGFETPEQYKSGMV